MSTMQILNVLRRLGEEPETSQELVELAAMPSGMMEPLDEARLEYLLDRV